MMNSWFFFWGVMTEAFKGHKEGPFVSCDKGILEGMVY